MPTLLRCPECEALLRIHEEHLGKPVRCPKCDAVVKTRRNSPPEAPLLPNSPAPADPSSGTIPADSVRRSVMIPLDLFKRMANVSVVNWSEVACQAFELKLTELAKLADTAHVVEMPQSQDSATVPASTPNLADVIERLRASKQSLNRKGYIEGLKAGQDWAVAHATAAELQALERFRKHHRDRDWETFFEFNNTLHTYAEALVMGFLPDLADVAAARRFWDLAVGQKREEDLDNPIFIKGFAEGALQVWSSVKDAV